MKRPNRDQIAYCVADSNTIKHAALFYDSVVPFPFEAVVGLKEMAYTSEQVANEIFEAIPEGVFKNLLGPAGYLALQPDEFGAFGHRFRALFLAQLLVLHEFSRQTAQEKEPWIDGVPAQIEVSELGFEPVLVMPEALLKDKSATDNDITITIQGAKLIDTSAASWDQIVAIRSNGESLRKLRNFRLSMESNYAGKSRAFIENDLGKRIDDYENVVKDYGFEVTSSALTMIVDSKSLISFSVAALGAAILGEPILASASLAGGVSLEIAKVSLEVAKRKHAFNKLRRDNDIGYILDVKKAIET